MNTGISVIFPTSEMINERWTMNTLCHARHDWMRERGLFAEFPSHLRHDWDGKREQWTYDVTMLEAAKARRVE
jgi:hypothetical protein